MTATAMTPPDGPSSALVIAAGAPSSGLVVVPGAYVALLPGATVVPGANVDGGAVVTSGTTGGGVGATVAGAAVLFPTSVPVHAAG